MTDFKQSGWGFGDEAANVPTVKKGPQRAVLPPPEKFKEPSRLDYALSDIWRSVKGSLIEFFGAIGTRKVNPFERYSSSGEVAELKAERDPKTRQPEQRCEFGLPRHS